MPRIKIPSRSLHFDVPQGANLMQSLRAQGLPVASSCGGEGVCTHCRVEVLEGSHNLSQKTAAETQWESKGRLQGSERLSCQAKVQGAITVTTPYW